MTKVGRATGVLVKGGVDLRPRTQFAAVKRSVCHKCGGSYGKAENFRQCDCPDGWEGTETDLGVISDSGPRRFLPRKIWQVQQWIAGVWEKLNRRAIE